MIEELGHGWRVEDGHHIEKTYSFDDFQQALEFTNAVGEVAEEEGHHPVITLEYGRAIEQ